MVGISLLKITSTRRSSYLDVPSSCKGAIGRLKGSTEQRYGWWIRLAKKKEKESGYSEIPRRKKN